MKNELKGNDPLKPNGVSNIINDEGWVDKQDLLSILNVSSRTLQKWRSKNLLPHSRIGGKIFYKLEDILDILEKNKTPKN